MEMVAGALRQRCVVATGSLPLRWGGEATVMSIVALVLG